MVVGAKCAPLHSKRVQTVTAQPRGGNVTAAAGPGPGDAPTRMPVHTQPDKPRVPRPQRCTHDTCAFCAVYRLLAEWDLLNFIDSIFRTDGSKQIQIEMNSFSVVVCFSKENTLVLSVAALWLWFVSSATSDVELPRGCISCLKSPCSPCCTGDPQYTCITHAVMSHLPYCVCSGNSCLPVVCVRASLLTRGSPGGGSCSLLKPFIRGIHFPMFHRREPCPGLRRVSLVYSRGSLGGSWTVGVAVVACGSD